MQRGKPSINGRGVPYSFPESQRTGTASHNQNLAILPRSDKMLIPLHYVSEGHPTNRFDA